MSISFYLLNKEKIVEAIRNAGVVGAGGAGFPTHIKASSSAEYVIANGAECEPLVHCNQELMLREAEKVVAGLELMMSATGAANGIIAIKRKNQAAGELERITAGRSRIKVFYLGDFYPAGDEHVLVYEATRRVVPENGIPLAVGVVVNNVETLANVAAAAEGQPVIEKLVSVTGAVANPVTLRVPIGASARELIALAGGALVENFAVIDGGPMMGRLVDTDSPVTKTTSGFIVLPGDHPVVQVKKLSWKAALIRARAACCSCRFCTDLCPRYLLGNRLEPHRIMQAVGHGLVSPRDLRPALLCSECGLCDVYACPMGLSPRQVNHEVKKQLEREGVRYFSERVEIQRPDSWREHRRVPTTRLLARLGLTSYEQPAPYRQSSWLPGSVSLMLKQHIGAACRAVVRPGDRVTRGQLVGDLPEGAVGAVLHSSISGTVRDVTETQVTITA